MENQYILFFVSIHVCAFAQDNYISHVSLANSIELTKVESPVEQKNKSAKNSIDVQSKTEPKISITVESDLSSQQNLTTASLSETNKNITTFNQEPYKLNDSLSKNFPNNITTNVSNQNILNENETSDNDFLKNVTNNFSTVKNILNSSHTSDSLDENYHDNSTTNKNTFEDSPVNNSSGYEINKSDENITLNNTSINDNFKQNLSHSFIESNHTQIKGSTDQSKESDVYNYTTHNESVTTTEYTDETSLSMDSNNSDDNDESTSETNTLNFDMNDILGTYDISDIIDENEEEEDEQEDEEEETEEYDDNEDDGIYGFDSSDDDLESDEPTTTKYSVSGNNNKLNQKSKGLGILAKLSIFSINIGFVFLAFWLTKTFIDRRVFKEVFSANIHPNGNVVGNSEIFLHKSVEVVILKQPFTENHKTTEYIGVWLF